MTKQRKNDERTFELRRMCYLALRKTGSLEGAVKLLDGTGMEYRMFCRHTQDIRRMLLEQGDLSEAEEKDLGELMYKYRNGGAKTPRRTMGKMVAQKGTIRWVM